MRDRDPKRAPDVIVERIPKATERRTSNAEPITARAVPHPHERRTPVSTPAPSSIELALEPLSEAIETVHTGELLVEAYGEREEPTPVTGISPWQRLVPPHLPESER